MAFTLTGLLRDSAGNLRSDWLEVTCTADAVVDTDNNVLWSGQGLVKLSAGALALELPAPGEGVLPEAFGFVVHSQATGEVWNVAPVEGESGDLTDFTSTTPVESPESLEVRVDDLEDRVEGLEEGGGGGGGAVDSVNGHVGVVVLGASDVGAQPTDGDLTTIAAIDTSTAGMLATDGAGWVRKSYAAVKTALGLSKADVGLGNVDNTSDANKPVSTAQATAISGAITTHEGAADPHPQYLTVEEGDDTYDPLGTTAAHIADTSAAHAASAIAFTPTGSLAATDVQAALAEAASEAAAAVSTEATARDAAIAAAIAALVASAPGVLDTLDEIAAALGDDANFATTMTNALAGKQASDAELSAIAGLASAANKLPYFTGSGTASMADFTAFARTLLDDADASTMRGTLGLGTAAVANVPASGDAAAGEVVKGNDSRLNDARTPTAHKSTHATGGTDALTPSDIGAQASDTELSALATLTSAANKLPYFTGAGTAALADLTSFIRTLLDDADAATARATLAAQAADGTYAVTTASSGAGTYTIPTVAAVNLTITGNVTLAFTAPTAGHTVMLRVSGAFTLSFPASVKWDSGAAPTYTTPALYVFTTLDGGTTWLGSQVGKGFA